MIKDAQLNVHNFKAMRALAPQYFDFIRFDSNNDCNVHCVYCHNHRSKDRIDAEEFRAFLEGNVLIVNNFQVGCIMEPTLDPRMCDLMLMVAHSRAKPCKTFTLQTNGILLHHHDYSKMRNAGLTHLSVSIDAADPTTHKLLRGGTSMAKVQGNIAAFQKTGPAAKVVFITTVTSVNLNAMEELVRFGLDLGVAKFVLRELFYYPENNVVDHARMPELLLKEHDFSRMKQRLMQRFENQADFEFADARTLDQAVEKIRAESFR